MITVIAEHSVDLDLLPQGAKIMDIGCRGFLFTNEMRRLGHEVHPIDIDPALSSDCYYAMAIAGKNGQCSIERNRDPQATKMAAGYGVPMMTIPSFSDMVKIPFWDLIKIDVEGAELEIIMSLTEPPAKQLSIEFHLHTKAYMETAIRQMEDKLLSLGYFPAKHDKTSSHGCGLNYWDSLFILR